MNNKRSQSHTSAILLSQFFLVVVAIFFIWVSEISLPASTLALVPAVSAGSLLAVFTFLLFYVIHRLGGWFAHSLLDDIRRVSALFTHCTWGHCVCIAALAGVGEELLFRGFLQIWLDGYFSVLAAILLASLMFGLLHYLSHAYFICATGMSIAFGVGYWLTDSLLMVIIWHGLYDFIALMVITRFPHVIGIDIKNTDTDNI